MVAVAGSSMSYGYFAASRPEQLGIMKGKINSQVYQCILQVNVRVAVPQLKLRRSLVMQQDDEP